MPEILNMIVPSGRLILWKIEESLDQLAAMVRPEDLRAVEGHRTPRRRAETLAWRAAVRRYRPDATLGYNELGAPTIECGPGEAGERFLSVSHGGDLVAVLFADAPCGVDVEPAGRDFSVATPRYISERERLLPSGGHALFPAVAWCAKETLYKLSGRRELNLLEDEMIEAADMADGTVTGRIKGSPQVEIRFFVVEDHLVAWAVGAKVRQFFGNIEL